MSKRDQTVIGVVVPAPGTGPAKDFDHKGWLESVGLESTAKAVRERDEAVEALAEARKQRDEAVGLLEDNGGRGFVDDLGGMDLRHGEKCDCWRHKVARFLARIDYGKKEGT